MNTQLISRLRKISWALALLLTVSVANQLLAQGYGPYGNGGYPDPNYSNGYNNGQGYGNGYNNGYGNGQVYGNGYNNGYGNGYNNGYGQGYPYPNQYGPYGPPVVYPNRRPVIIIPAPLPPVIYAPAPVIVQRPRYIVPAPRFGGGNYAYRQRGFGGHGRRW